MSEEQVPSVDRFLVVDDSSTNRLLLRAILQKAGFEVDECENGREALEYCQKQTPRMVLLDIMMPEVNGIEACSLLREKHSKDALPIIMVTTKSESDDIAMGLAAGANDYVTKPVDKKVLLARIESQLNVTDAHNLIEEQKRSVEEALRIQSAMGDVLPDAIAVTNHNGVVLYSNDLLLNQCEGQEPRKDNELFDFVYAGRLAAVYDGLHTKIQINPEAEIDEEFEVFSGGYFTYRIVSRPIVLENSGAMRVWLFRDLTQVRELERKINQQLKLDTVSTFASGVAHNFNNMMGGILGAAQLLKRRVAEDESCVRLVDVIERAVTSGACLTEKMSSLVHKELESGVDERESVVRVLEIVATATQEVAEKNVTISLSGEEELYVNLSLKNMIDIFQNLTSNAIDAIADTGSVEIEVYPDGSGDFVIVRVVDNGKGMTPADLQRIFEPFYSTKNLDKRNNVSMEGNGLGMWNVYNLVKSCGGDIAIESTPGRGTEVVIQLPRMPADGCVAAPIE